jgi:hypothetical protein
MGLSSSPRSGYESELAQLYHFLERPQKEGMFMLKQAFRIKNVRRFFIRPTLFQLPHEK